MTGCFFFVFVEHSTSNSLSTHRRLYIVNVQWSHPHPHPKSSPSLFLSLSITLMEAVHVPYQVHPHSLAAAAKDRKPQFHELPDPDIHIVTSGGLRIPAHSTILVLRRISLLPFFFSFKSHLDLKCLLIAIKPRGLGFLKFATSFLILSSVIFFNR